MNAKIQKFFSNLDPFLIISILFLIILTPIGFTIDRTHLEKQCNCGPLLFTQSNATTPIPAPFIEFLNESKEFIELVISKFSPSQNFSDWVQELKYANDRGVHIDVVTDDEKIANALSVFCDVTFVNFSITNARMFVFFAQSDHKRTIYASRLFNDWTENIDSFFLIDFND